ncbi:tubulin-like doman-containing protein [Actinomadura oligospora]|uniref:tubulin-like doman-containing protein n=1 Tax=Actinomadura oligospora TaxID=111804 RepID=UPI0004B14ECC|nr:tubulin-like doman-containing protein [Actinomadura oligospora]
MTIKLHHPVMFVGLGGSGCRIGAELERRLREEICGPDGTEFRRRRDAMRYELPSCLRFVYADVSQAELERLPAQVVPDPAHLPAARATAHYLRGLVPRADTYPELARNLRLWMPGAVDWLPPASGEPRVSPLTRGAGQLPTIGRAVLFESFRDGTGPVVRELDKAIGGLASGTAHADLFALADGDGADAAAVDVFVAFSVAGGTGAGLFHDILHLVAQRFERTALRPKIYPLVLLPSAFPDGLGGGRPAQLNAARALLDLFRLVDQQNSGDEGGALHAFNGRSERPPDDVAVRHPDGQRTVRVAMRPGVTQTAFLFTRPAGIDPEDLRRSVASLVLSLIGTRPNEQAMNGGEQYQSFADSFINTAVERQTRAPDGIGDRGVSTALVASLGVPVDELADLVAERLLADGVAQLAAPPGAAEANRDSIERFFAAAGLHELLARAAEDFDEPQPTRGARNITLALSDRSAQMHGGLDLLRARLDREVPDLVAGFDPVRGLDELLGDHDPFRAQRAAFGHPELAGALDRLGASGLLARRRQSPEPPELDGGGSRPRIPDLHDRRGGFMPARWSDPGPVRAREDQDAWYEWRTNVLWTEPWSRLTPRWRPQLERAEAMLRAFTDAMEDRARRERDRQSGRAERLCRSRAGQSYLLPDGGNLDRFHRTVLRRITEAQVAAGVLPAGARDGELLNALVGTDGWRAAFASLQADSGVDTATRAVDGIKARLATAVKGHFRHADLERGPLLPMLGDLLTEAAGQGPGRLGEEELAPFRAKLAGLVPPDFTPQGRGVLKVLVSYPAAAADPAIDAYLRRTLALPGEDDAVYQFTHGAAETVSVVLFRTSMGITDVREVREVLRAWADALERPLPQDYLRWRQRTGYDFGYLATREEHRVQILHRLLCAMWNGRVTVDGDPASPASVKVRFSPEVAMTLRLQPLDRASSWGSLLRAYEMCSFADDSELRRDFCARLMREVPDGVDTRPVPPHELYRLFVSLAGEEIVTLDELAPELNPPAQAHAAQLRGFWTCTLPAALAHEFTEVHAIRRNLLELERAESAQRPGVSEWAG